MEAGGWKYLSACPTQPRIFKGRGGYIPPRSSLSHPTLPQSTPSKTQQHKHITHIALRISSQHGAQDREELDRRQDTDTVVQRLYGVTERGECSNERMIATACFCACDLYPCRLVALYSCCASRSHYTIDYLHDRRLTNSFLYNWF